MQYASIFDTPFVLSLHRIDVYVPSGTMYRLLQKDN